MATSEILAAGTAAADSSDVTVAAGTPVTIFLKASASGPVPSDADFDVKVKSSGSTYHTIGKLTGTDPAKIIDGPGTYRISRVRSSSAVGVDKA